MVAEIMDTVMNIESTTSINTDINIIIMNQDTITIGMLSWCMSGRVENITDRTYRNW
ncbi:hypothetical protein PSSHI_09130 [Photobacterium sp. R1]